MSIYTCVQSYMLEVAISNYATNTDVLMMVLKMHGGVTTDPIAWQVGRTLWWAFPRLIQCWLQLAAENCWAKLFIRPVAIKCVHMHAVFFSGPLGGKFSPPKFWISPPNNNEFRLFFGYSSHFLSPQKQFPPQNYISRKNPACMAGETDTNH